MIFEPTREQTARAEALSLRNASVRCDPITEPDGNLVLEVTGFAEAMGFSTRAPRVHTLTINPDGQTVTNPTGA